MEACYSSRLDWRYTGYMEEKVIFTFDDTKLTFQSVWDNFPCLNPLELCQWDWNVFNELVLKRGNYEEI
jgi:hypothetical protein